jgi:hypothetical protein
VGPGSRASTVTPQTYLAGTPVHHVSYTAEAVDDTQVTFGHLLKTVAISKDPHTVNVVLLHPGKRLTTTPHHPPLVNTK